MIDFYALDKPCPKCSGLGRIENPQWLQFWTKMEPFRTSIDQLSTLKMITSAEPTEPMFFVCKECHGKGKILTTEGKKLIEFIRFWLNPNY
ncbi:hypothetical protein ACPUYX_10705 [Desulfosporosinus sp. SYSU MS00001]|uniref:hypothetical protein n=1 Tax=Desulfosporosinus sp. SYSU MS00001 TaxID=3416284 RepID=UPI003CF9852C